MGYITSDTGKGMILHTMIKVTNELPTYDDPAKPNLRVHSHWNDPNLVVIEIDGKNVTVVAHEATAAIENATNTRRLG